MIAAASPSEAALVEVSMAQRTLIGQDLARVAAAIRPRAPSEPDPYEALLLEAFRRLSPDGKTAARAILFRMETIEAGGDRVTGFHLVSRTAGEEE